MNPCFQSQNSSVLIATLGSEPQVVTAALLLLKASGERIQSVNVIHTSSDGDPIEQAVLTLKVAAHSPDFPAGIAVHFSPIVTGEGKMLADIDTPSACEAAFRTLYNAVRHAKQSGARVHLLIAGGRKTVSIYGMVAAQLLFGDEDCLWHLHSCGEFLASRRLYPAAGDEVHLVPIPVILWRQVSPALGDLREVDDPLAAIARYRSLRLDERMARSKQFLEQHLTRSEIKAVELLVVEGLSDNEIASRLVLSTRTVEHHLRSTFRKASAFWNIADVNRTTLVTLLNLYFSLSPETREKIGENTEDPGRIEQ